MYAVFVVLVMISRKMGLSGTMDFGFVPGSAE